MTKHHRTVIYPGSRFKVYLVINIRREQNTKINFKQQNHCTAHCNITLEQIFRNVTLHFHKYPRMLVRKYTKAEVLISWNKDATY